MNRTADGVILTDDETQALARYLIARHVKNVLDYGGDIEWEAAPDLCERAWELVCEAMDREVEAMLARVDVNGVDARWVHGEVQ